MATLDRTEFPGPNRINHVAISVPAELLDAIEKERNSRGSTRSAIVQEALKQWLAGLGQRVLVQRYENGYQRQPESPDEGDAANWPAAALASQDW